jgi:hypothetical protein
MDMFELRMLTESVGRLNAAGEQRGTVKVSPPPESSTSHKHQKTDQHMCRR